MNNMCTAFVKLGHAVVESRRRATIGRRRLWGTARFSNPLFPQWAGWNRTLAAVATPSLKWIGVVAIITISTHPRFFKLFHCCPIKISGFAT